ncbi:cyanophycin synthetase [Massilia sp. Root133]|uniref:Cyanophycin synthetase n=1 Tax=Massilia cellulosiltytica TaxID=2683234 RepID=A0A7X3KA62_9BURK|nr:MULTISPECIES: cyanophycin synthetase [Telluria group]KQX96928.1 cyanophycin synthetase [Massilia sp. Root133]KQZ52632.1 cyanophycin synthetase [Massilia sp. Root1485]MVW63287.1 cyanophycin synthetase [Telluria cellulosilytica]
MTNKKDIAILRVNHLRGPNIWTYRPVIETWLDIGELEECPSNKLPGLYERLTAWLPGLIEHRCGVGERGGFLERLRDGTWSGHILEHIVLELQNLAGMKTGFGKTRSTADHGIYKMAFRTRDETVGRAALQAGHALLMSAINDTPFDLQAKVDELTELVDRYCLGPSTGHIVDAATDRRIPSIRLTEGNLVQLGHGSAQRRIWTAETDRTSAIGESIASDKDLTKTLLASCGVPVPEGSVVRSAAAAWEEAQDIGLPVAIKPVDGNHGRGVSLNLMSEADVHAAYAIAAEEGDSSAVLVERFIPGNEHRLLVVGSKVVAAAKGESLWVVGDGTSTVTQLCDSQINIDPRRGNSEEFPLSPVVPAESDEVMLDLKRQGLTPDSVPQAGQKVLIQLNGNVADDVTDEVHPDVAHVAALAARVVGLDIAGIDLVCEDISRPLEEQRGAIIEVNSSPGLLAHIKPAQGEPRNVGKAIVEHLFAEGETGRIPLVGVTGTTDAALAARLVGTVLNLAGKHVGVANREGLFLDGRQVTAQDGTRFDAGQRLLINRTVQAAVFESNARTILTEGLPYDRCLVGIVTDMGSVADVADLYVRDDDALYNVVRSQVDVVLSDGAAVLDAADERVAALAELSDGAVLFYAQDEANATLAAHRAGGGRVAFVRNHHIVLAQGSEEVPLLGIDKVKPATAAQPNALLAAALAGWALDVPTDLICAGLRTFDPAGKKKKA